MLSLQDPNALSLHSGKNVKIYIFARSVWRSSNSSINHYGQ